MYTVCKFVRMEKKNSLFTQKLAYTQYKDGLGIIIKILRNSIRFKKFFLELS